jgi:transposase
MEIAPETLPDDAETLKQMVLEFARHRHILEREKEQLNSDKEKLSAEKHILRQRILTLEEYIRLAKQQRFGASSEQSPDQIALFNEAEETLAGDSDIDETPAEVEPAAPRRQKPIRKPLPAHLPRVVKIYELPLEQRQCDCGCTLCEIGEEISEQLEMIPAQFQVIRHVRKKYACKGCEDKVRTADKPPQMLPKSNASAATLAAVIIHKYQDGLPLYRQSQIFERLEIDLSRQTLSGWVLGTAQRLTAFAAHMHATLLQGALIHMDETVVQVLHEPDKPEKSAQSQSYMWVSKGGPPGKPVVLFDYDSSRSSAAPLRLLAGYEGALMTDGYEGYNAVVKKNNLTHLCCMVHLRRKFKDAQKALPAKTRNARIEMALSYIARLYAIERQHEECDSDTRLRARQEQSKPLLEKFKVWLDKAQKEVRPKGKLGEAIRYAQKYWSKLTRYVENGDWPIDNNVAENAIRPFVVGRKAWLFSNTANGAHASATLYSIIETAKANGHEPYHYLRWLFETLPQTDDSDMESLMPWSGSPATTWVL